MYVPPGDFKEHDTNTTLLLKSLQCFPRASDYFKVSLVLFFFCKNQKSIFYFCLMSKGDFSSGLS